MGELPHIISVCIKLSISITNPEEHQQRMKERKRESCKIPMSPLCTQIDTKENVHKETTVKQDTECPALRTGPVVCAHVYHTLSATPITSASGSCKAGPVCAPHSPGTRRESCH